MPSTRALSPVAPLEPIEEEKSELAMDIAQAVVEKLDIDRKLDERMKGLMLRGDCIFRDMQIRQEQSTEALCRTVSMCMESQRAFQEEHQRLLAAVKELATMVMPFTPLHSQALEAQARAAAIVGETEAMRKHMEDHRISSAFAAAAAAAPTTPVQPPQTSAHQPALLTPSSPASPQLGSGTFSITLRKADEVSLGLSVNTNEEDSEALIVEAVLAGGAVDSWNRQCIGDGSGERVVVPGHRIVKVNGIENDVNKMLEECTKQRLVKLLIARSTRNASASPSRPSSPAASAESVTPVRPQSAAAALETPEFMTPEKNMLRKKAPEFVPSDVAKHLATLFGDAPEGIGAPPGLFFPRHEMSSHSSARMEGAAGAVSNAYGVACGMQDACEDVGSEKEN